MDNEAKTRDPEDATLLSQVQLLARKDPDKPAYVFVDKDLGHRVITRQDLWDKTRKCAAMIKRLGLGKGDIVCNTLVNSPERLITYFGTLAAGAITCHGQLFLANGSDLIHNLRESQSKAIIYDPGDPNGTKGILDQIKYTDENTGATCYKDLPHLQLEIEIRAKGLKEEERWIKIMDNETEMFWEENITKDDIAMVFNTSGTTGFSKLVPHPHSTLLGLIQSFATVESLGENTSIFNMNSLGWLGGFSSWYTSFGCKRVLTDLTNGAPDNMGDFLVSVFNENDVKAGLLMSRDIQCILDSVQAGNELKQQLSTILTGGGPIHTATMQALGKITQKVHAVYGGTEFLLASAYEVEKTSDFQDMCAGKPLFCELKIVGEDEREVPAETHGEIYMRSGSVFKGYLNNPTKTAAAFTDDGWYRTGDIGYFNKEGLLFVLCRKADAINKDGFIHYPGWMEQLINKHPGLEKAMVIGIPDPVHHEEICLCYKPVADADLTTDDLREYCKKLFLTDEKDKMTPLPEYYLEFNEFITNNNGKVDRKKMREDILKRLSSDQ